MTTSNVTAHLPHVANGSACKNQTSTQAGCPEYTLAVYWRELPLPQSGLCCRLIISPTTEHPKSPTLDPGGNLPVYLIECGWIVYVQALRANPSALLQLVALPSPRMVNTWLEHSEGYHIEEGLSILSNTMHLYLLTADTRVNSCHESVRDTIVGE